MAIVVAVFGLVLLPMRVSAHHSFAAEFIQEPGVIEGIVTEVWFRAPHIRYYIEVTREDGSVEMWDTRGGSPSSLMRRSGWNPKSVEVGEHVVIDGYLGRDGRKLMSIRTITKDDGSVLVAEAGLEVAYPEQGDD